MMHHLVQRICSSIHVFTIKYKSYNTAKKVNISLISCEQNNRVFVCIEQQCTCTCTCEISFRV